jgi:hypothetical protein
VDIFRNDAEAELLYERATGVEQEMWALSEEYTSSM